MTWPTAEIEVAGERTTVTYCCWTFCAWPEMARLLRVGQFWRCKECPRKAVP